MPVLNLRNLGLIIPEVAFFLPVLYNKFIDVFGANFGESKIWFPTKQWPNLARCMGFENCKQWELNDHCHKFKSLVISLKWRLKASATFRSSDKTFSSWTRVLLFEFEGVFREKRCVEFPKVMSFIWRLRHS